MAAILLKSLGQESSAQLKTWKPLMQAKGTGEGVRQQSSLIEVSCCIGSAKHKYKYSSGWENGEECESSVLLSDLQLVKHCE